MKRLEKIRVVQFFLFEQQEILLDEITGIFGQNGGGKSSMLDAVQIAMFGGNSRLVALNAQAEEEKHTTRSLRTYCLGQWGENPEDRARENATTYISLIWRDTVTNQPTTMGVCISAASDRESHEVLGRYLVPGVELMMTDHIENVNGLQRPREWSTFRHQLMERARISGEETLFPDAQRYINAVLLALRGSVSAPHTESFTRAFRFALRMRFDKSVDQIVRNDVLESRPTNVKKFREVTESFRLLAELVAQIETKLADGRKVEVDFNKAAEESRRSATWDVMGKVAAVEVANEAWNEASDAKAEVEGHLEEQRAAHQSLEGLISATVEQARDRRLAKESHAAHKDYGLLQTEIEAATQRSQEKTRALLADLGMMRRTLRDASGSALLKDSGADLTSAVAAITSLIENEGKLAAADVESRLRPAIKAAVKAHDWVHGMENVLKQDLTAAQDRLKDAKAALQRVNEGRAPLSDGVQRLLTELQDHGLNPVPVCDLVRITDPEWQPVIESYLGSNLQALLVSADDEVQAFRLYRGMTGQRAVYGAKIARESQQLTPVREISGSVAALIEGDRAAAVTYLMKKFGDLMRGESESEAFSGKRVLTKDGMLVSGGEIERLRLVPPRNFMIGAGSPVHLDALQGDVKVHSDAVVSIERALREAGTLLTSLRMIASEDLVLKSVKDALVEIGRADNEAALKSSNLQGAADADYVRLGEEERALNEQAETYRQQLQTHNREIGALDTKLIAKTTQEALAQQKAEEASAQALQAKSHPEYDHEFWLTQWDRVIETFDGRFAEMVIHCNQQRDFSAKRMNDAARAGMREFGVFLEKYKEQTMEDTSTDWQKAREWLTDLIVRLEETELADNKAQMDDAYRTSQETFRNDVAIALHNNLEWLAENMDRLNAVLKTCPTFSNGERYHFRRTVRPELESLYKFIKDVASYGPTQDLLGGAGEIPEAFQALLNDKITPGAAGVKSPLDDYREFFDFDIEILREDPLTKETKLTGHLSKRLGSGSGGEHRSPLYVIAGAALASAYRLDRGNRDGMRLMLLDEAFNKMDPTNIIATMRYLEELGLQVFMASPGENLGTLSAFLHRYYDIVRDAENNTVMFEPRTLSEDIRAMFREDLPEFNPDLVEREIAAMGQAKMTATEAEVVE